MQNIEQLKIFGNKVLIQLEIEPNQKKLESGLILVNTKKKEDNKTDWARVVKVGDGDNISVKVGDRVIYDKHAGYGFRIKEDYFLLVDEDDLFAVEVDE